MFFCRQFLLGHKCRVNYLVVNNREAGRELTRGEVGGENVNFLDLVGVPKNSPAAVSQS